jgi:CheY-like chemotaxis protein
VVTAQSAKEALDRLRAQQFDVVISDLGLGSGMDGWTLAAEVRRTWPRVRFVVATGAAGVDPRGARAAGIAAVLHKPYRPQELRILLTELGSPSAEQAA